MIETVDSGRLTQTLDRYCANIQKRCRFWWKSTAVTKQSKTGVLPEAVDELVIQMSKLSIYA